MQIAVRLYWTGHGTCECFFPVFLQYVVAVYRLSLTTLVAVLRTIEVSSTCPVPQKYILSLLHLAQYYVNSLQQFLYKGVRNTVSSFPTIT